MRVLHVTDAWASGVATAIEGWVRADSSDEHVLLVRGRTGFPTPFIGGVQVVPLPHGSFVAARALLRTTRELRPDVVHAHSSRAGVLARVLPLRCRVVYTPHAYAFLRTDIGPVRRSVFRTVERVLARRGTTAACGEYEAALARSIAPARRVVVLPYVVPGVTGPRPARDAATPIVVLSGRLTAQKGVGFAAEVATLVHRVRPEVRFVWVGDDADDSAADLLRAEGVELTGWLAREAALERVAAADVYLHTAAWEGMPLTVLEALALGVPVVARRLPPLDELGLPQGETSADVAALVLAQLSPAGRAAGVAAAAAAQAARPRPDAVAELLARLYRS